MNKTSRRTNRWVLTAVAIGALALLVAMWLFPARPNDPRQTSLVSLPTHRSAAVPTPAGSSVAAPAPQPAVVAPVALVAPQAAGPVGVAALRMPNSAASPMATIAGQQHVTPEGVLTPPATNNDRYANAKVLDEKIGPVGPDGRYERVRVVQTEMKYPFVRVVEVWETRGGNSVFGAGIMPAQPATPHSPPAAPYPSRAWRHAPDATSPSPAATPYAPPDTRHAPPDTLLSQTAMVADHVTVQANPGVTEADLSAAVAANNGTILRKLRAPGPGLYLVQYPNPKVDTVPNALASLANKPYAIASAEADYIVYACETTPNDPMFNQLWGMKNAGQVPYNSAIIASSNRYSAINITYGPITPTNGVIGLLYDCGYGLTNEFPAVASGYIALIQRGATNNETMSFAQKVTNAKTAGAAAAIIYNNVSGDLNGTLGGPGDWIPAVGVADTTGAELLGMTNSAVTVLILTAPTLGDIRATTAWDNGIGSREVLVGVIDTGIDYNHEDLKDNMWVNPGETGLDATGRDKRTNGVDDDGNGYIDDWHGWDFCNNDNDSMDDHYHGTHCAGTIGGVGNNNIGVAGVCWKVSLVGLKFLSHRGSGPISDAIEATYYATKMGAKLTSNSWGGGGFSTGLFDAITDAGRSNVLFVAAAGNDGWDNDVNLTYPASYDCANIISVAATDSGDARAYFSNYGATTVDLGAPGVGILSCQPGNKYQLLSGTSMATPHVAGACALAWSRAPYWNAAQIKNAILSAVDPILALAGGCVTGGRLNIAKITADRVAVMDWSFDDTLGNNDGVVNADETINLTVTFKNLSTNAATGVQASLAALTNAAILSGQTNIGTLATGATVIGAFQVRVNAGVPSAGPVKLQITITDDAGGPWVFPLTLTTHISGQISGTVKLDGTPAAGVRIAFAGHVDGVRTTDALGSYSFPVIEGAYTIQATNGDWVPARRTITVTSSVTVVDFTFTTATISGIVKDALTLAAVSGATVTASGPYIQATLTDAGGVYTLPHVYGATSTVLVTATKGAYLGSATRSVTVPPDAPGTDFLIGSPEIKVQPTNLLVYASLPDPTNSVLTISNEGGSDLNWRIRHTTAPIPTRAEKAGALLKWWNISPDHGSVRGAAFDGTALYLSDEINYSPVKIRKFDPEDGHLLGTLDVSASLPGRFLINGMTFYGTNLWIAARPNQGGSQDRLYAVNPSNGQLITSFPTPTNLYGVNAEPYGLAAGGGALWMIEDPDHTLYDELYKIDPVDGSILKKFDLSITAGIFSSNRWFSSVNSNRWLSSVTYFNGALWATIEEGVKFGDTLRVDGVPNLYKIDPEDGTIIARLENLAGTSGLFFSMTSDGKQNLWVVSFTPSYPRGTLAVFQYDTGETDWLQAIPDRGTTSSTSTQEVAIVFDSAVVGPGEYHADMVVESNDSRQPAKHVDVRLVVPAPFSIAGRATLDGAPLSNAVIRYSGPYAGSVLSGSDGAYSIGVATGSYTLVASKGNYLASAPQTVTIGPSRSDVDFPFTTATISGTARDNVTGAAINNATIQFSGAFQGSVTTAANGAYAIERVYGQTGTLMLTASKPPAYADSATVTITVPPNRFDVDFLMGNPQIAVTPASFTAEVFVGQIATQILTIANTGYGPLRWSTWGTEDVTTHGAGDVIRTLTNIAGLDGIAFDGTALWMNHRSPILNKLDPNDGRILRQLDLTGLDPDPGCIAWDGSNLWLVGNGTKRVYGIDKDTGNVIRSLPMPDAACFSYSSRGIAVGEGSLWIRPYNPYLPPSEWEDRVYKMNLQDGSQQGWIETHLGTQIVSPDGIFTNSSTRYQPGLTYFCGALWATHTDLVSPAMIFKLNPANGQVMASFPSPDPNPRGIVSDGRSRLWITAGQTNKAGATTPNNPTAYLVTSGEITWLRPTPNSGTVSASSSTNVPVVFDATCLAVGVYTAALHVASNDGLRPDVTVPVVLRVVKATMIDADAASLRVPEGGTNTFRVRLAKRPSSTVTVTVARSDGDSDITVLSGATLVFDANNWDTYRTVVLAAAEDADSADGSATIILSAAGIESVPIVITEADNDTVLRLFAGVGGAVSPGAVVVPKGAAVPVSAIANAGYNFVRWVAVDGMAEIADSQASNTTAWVVEPTMIHAIFARSAGPLPATTLWAWGYNGCGTLGDGTRSNRLAPVRVSGISGLSAVSAGDFHSLALKNDGTVWSWGWNYRGELGIGSTIDQYLPVQVTLADGMPLSNVCAVAAGAMYSLALKNDGSVWAWGYNGDGALGDGSTLNRNRPVLVQGLSNVTAIAASLGAISYAIKSNGTVWAWGSNYYGLGDGTSIKRSLSPVQVKLASGIALSNVTAVSAGNYHTLALKNDGSVWAWGRNIYGALGDGTKLDRNTPVLVQGITNATGVAVDAFESSFATMRNGSTWAWGFNGFGQLGIGITDVTFTNGPFTPVLVPGLTNCVIDGGYCYSVARKSDGTVWSWGVNPMGQLGDGTTRSRNAPVHVPELAGVFFLSAGGYYNGPSYGHTLALRYDLTADPAYGYEQWLKARFTTAQLADLSISGDDADPDHDGANNTAEYLTGSDPRDASSHLVLFAATADPQAPGEFVIRWQSVAGKHYAVQATTNLLLGFNDLRTNILATPTVNVHTDNVSGVGCRFYRVKLE